MIALSIFDYVHLLKRGLVEIREDVDGLGRQLRRMEASLRQSSINSANGLRTSASFSFKFGLPMLRHAFASQDWIAKHGILYNTLIILRSRCGAAW